jgi:hypothetical protein
MDENRQWQRRVSSTAHTPGGRRWVGGGDGGLVMQVSGQTCEGGGRHLGRPGVAQHVPLGRGDGWKVGERE